MWMNYLNQFPSDKVLVRELPLNWDLNEAIKRASKNGHYLKDQNLKRKICFTAKIFLSLNFRNVFSYSWRK